MIIVITGPTAVGKTEMSIALAKALNGEIMNADSTQIYRGLDIATAKITDEKKQNIPHHLFDIKSITEGYTVFDYQKDAREKIREIESRGKTPILVGGTGLYIKACLYDYQFDIEPMINNFDTICTDDIYQELSELDPNHGIHPHNRKRLIRALSYVKNNGRLISEKEKTNHLLYDVVFIGLTTSREILYERINNRVDEMLEQGLLAEAKQIYDSNIKTKAVLTPIGYKELFPYFEGNSSLDICISKIKQNSRKYAKRQYTWFRHQLPIIWFDVDFENFSNTVNDVLQYINSR